MSEILLFPHVGALRLPHRRFFRPAAVTAILDAASRMRRPVDTISAADVESATLSLSH